MYGIPNMKLEKTYIERKVKLMEKEGVVFKTGVNVGVDVKAQDLKKQYDAVVLCCGYLIQETSKHQAERAKEFILQQIT